MNTPLAPFAVGDQITVINRAGAITATVTALRHRTLFAASLDGSRTWQLDRVTGVQSTLTVAAPAYASPAPTRRSPTLPTENG